MSEKTLKEKTFSGLKWSSVSKLFQQIFMFISMLAFARMINKESYGLIGLLAIFSGMSNVLMESGFTPALIRKKNTSQSDYITVFYFNIGVAICLYLVLFFCAPLISNFYNKPELTPLSRIVFLSFLLNSFGVIQNAKLLKDLNYKFIAKNNIASNIISYSTALVLAYLGYEYWAFAAQMVVFSLVRTCNYWIFNSWRPSGSFSKSAFSEFFAFSSKLTAGSILSSFITNIPQNIIGKQYTLGITGLYNQANKQYNTVIEFLSDSVLSIPYPVLSEIDDEERFKRIFRKFVRLKALIVFPLFMGIILVADPFVNIALGKTWADVVPVLQLISIGGIFWAFDSSNGDLLKIKNKAGVIFIFVVLHAILILCLVGITLVYKLDYLWLIAGFSIIYFLRYLAMSIYSNRLINYRFIELCKDLLPYFFVALAANYSGYLLHYIIYSKLALMLCQIAFVAFLYVGTLYFSGSVLVKETLNLLKKKGESLK